MNGLQLISSSMRQIGVLAAGETLPADLGQDGLMVLNQMLDSWNADRLTVFTIARQSFNLVPGQQVYTMGTGGNFNVPRPAKVERVSIVQLNNTNQPLELSISYLDFEEWQAIPVKNITSTLPTVVYDDQQYPLRNLSYWPVPQTIVETIFYSWTALTSFPDLTTDISFPPGYSEALRYNLAVRLIGELPGQFNPIMLQSTGALATESLARVRSMNLPNIDVHIDPFLLEYKGRYNYIDDLPVSRRNW